MSTATLARPKVVSQAEWLAASKQLLIKEKNLTREKDALSAERRELPWVKVDKEYVFDSPGGKKTLADLFDGRSQLIVYHFMFGPDWEEGCPSCSMVADHFDGAVTHLANRDVTLAVVSRAPLPKIAAFKLRMGWRFKWVSSFGNDFNRDYHVSFTKEEVAQGNMYYNYTTQPFPSDEAQGPASSTRTRRATFITPTRRMGAELRCLLGPTTIWTSRPKAATKMAWSSRWHGYGIMIATATIILRRRNRSRAPRVRQVHAVRSMLETNSFSRHTTDAS